MSNNNSENPNNNLENPNLDNFNNLNYDPHIFDNLLNVPPLNTPGSNIPQDNNKYLNELIYNNQILTSNLTCLSYYPINEFNNLHNDNKNLKRKYDELDRDFDDEKRISSNLRRKNFELRDKIQKLENAKKPKENNNKYKFYPYEKTKYSYSERRIKDELISIKCNEDILKLKNKFRYIKHNEKLQKLYNLIPAIEKLNKLVGLDNIKKDIFKKIIFYIQNPNNLDYLHTVIYGSPGSGKTELAKIYGEIFLRLGLLKTDKFIEVKRDDLIGKYLGQTAPKTREWLDKSLGGVFFLDEAYSLGCSGDHQDSYSKESIDMINQYLSEKKTEFMMIIVGYEKELDESFFSYNPGLKRRFSSFYKIEPYTHFELCNIFKNKVKEINYNLMVEDEYLDSFFLKNTPSFKYFGGDIEKFITQIKYSHSLRTFYINDNNLNIEKSDIEEGYKKYRENSKEESKSLPINLYT